MSSFILIYFLLVLYFCAFYIQSMKKSSKTDARKYCANWHAGKCLGAMMYRKDGELRFAMDGKKVGKNCIVDEGCDYFDNIVIPGMENNGQ